MKDQIISFSTAKLAKECRFDIIQRYGSESSLYNKKGEHTYYVNYGFMYSGLSDGYISAPTQSLLQKWLREVHNKQVEISLIYDKYSVEVFPISQIKVKTLFSYYTKFDTYEEALEQGLVQALKLLK
jgi:hypothetical protein